MTSSRNVKDKFSKKSLVIKVLRELVILNRKVSLIKARKFKGVLLKKKTTNEARKEANFTEANIRFLKAI